VKLSRSQRDVLARMATGGVLFVRLERTGSGVEETCWIGSFELNPMTVNALITAGLIARQDEVRGKNGGRTASYAMSYTGQAALHAS
jgi:hypothetical protein